MDIALLRSSFALVIDRCPELIHRFYEILFQRYPQARPLFGRNPRNTQEKMLTEALVAVLNRLEDGEWFTRTLETLGEKHVAYGVTDEMYGWVGESLLAALAEAAGPEWTAAMNESWSAAYGAIATTMQAGARRATRPAAKDQSAA
jgi:hemoglobin-like flavoprotein